MEHPHAKYTNCQCYPTQRSCYCAKSHKHRHTHTHMPLQMYRLLFEEKRLKESTCAPFRYVQRTFAGKRHLTPAAASPRSPFHKKLGRQPHYTWNYYLGKQLLQMFVLCLPMDSAQASDGTDAQLNFSRCWAVFAREIGFAATRGVGCSS